MPAAQHGVSLQIIRKSHPSAAFVFFVVNNPA